MCEKRGRACLTFDTKLSAVILGQLADKGIILVDLLWGGEEGSRISLRKFSGNHQAVHRCSTFSFVNPVVDLCGERATL